MIDGRKVPFFPGFIAHGVRDLTDEEVVTLGGEAGNKQC
jgi:hypothetical protein